MKQLLGILSVFILFQAHGMSLKELSPSELNDLKSGKLIIKQIPKKGGPWPELQIYGLINANPLESVAIFAAYEHQKDYVPKLLKSKVIGQKDPKTYIVDYELDLPWPVSNSQYRHKITFANPGQDHYRIRWLSLEANDAELMEGQSNFINYDAQNTLWLYQSYVVPKSFLAGLFEKNMLKDVRRSLDAIRRYISTTKRNNKPLMKLYMGHIINAMAGKYSYPNISSKQK